MTSSTGIINDRILTINSPSINSNHKKTPHYQELEQGSSQSVAWHDGARSLRDITKQRVAWVSCLPVLLKTEIYFPQWKQRFFKIHIKKRGTDFAMGKHGQNQVIWFSKADHTSARYFMGICRNLQVFCKAEIFTVQLTRTETQSGEFCWKRSVNRSSFFQVGIFHISANSCCPSSPFLLLFRKRRGGKKK